MLSKIAPLSFNSLYILLELNALEARNVLMFLKTRGKDNYLETPITDVKSLGLPGNKFVKMNSNLVWLHFVKRYKASVTPRSLELTVLVVMFRIQLYPTAEKMVLKIFQSFFVQRHT